MDELTTDKEQKADTRNQAEGFSRRMDELETAIMATALAVSIVRALASKVLQSA